MHKDVYQMYLDEIRLLKPCTLEEEKALLEESRKGSREAKNRLLEANLGKVEELARNFSGQGLPMEDLVQEANMVLMMAIEKYEGEAEDFSSYVETTVSSALQAAVNAQKMELQTEEEVLARVNVLQEVSRRMAEELGREASVEELAEKMKMTDDEIRSIMKLTLDAMSVSPDAEI